MGNCCKKEAIVAGIVDNVPAYSNRGINFGANYVLFNNTNVYTGAKYQCVEYSRRYLILTKGVTFDDIPCAYHIFDLQNVTEIDSKNQRKFVSYPQGCQTPPQKGDLIIYQKSGKQWWGHVAVVSNVKENLIELAEQNYDEDWDHQTYARKVVLNKEGDNYFLTNNRPYRPHTWDVNQTIIGWKRVE